MNALARFTTLALLAYFALEAQAQRVQFPTATQPLTAAPPTTFASPPPPSSAFAAPPVTQPLFPSSPVYAPPYTPPAPFTSPPPAFSMPAAAPITPIPTTPAPAMTPPYPTTTAPFTSPFTSAPPITPAPSLTTPAPAVPGAVGPPPFDPYSTGTPLGPPPPAVPYTYSPPPVAAPQASPLYPDGLPYQWQPGTGSGTEGYYDKAQRLLQELSFEFTWLYGEPGDPNDFGWSRAEVTSTFAVPMFYNVDTPLLITPGFAFNWLQGPVSGPVVLPPPAAGGPDLPPQIYDAYLDFAWYPRFNQWLGAELGVRTGVWTDFDHVTDDSVRILGRGLASVSVTPTLDILFGAVYLDRLDIKLLPAGGVYWRPTPEWDAYLVFPNPKVRKYWANIGNSKVFWYVAGEYGGGSWTVQRQTRSDRIDINDIRVIGGIEWETQTQIRGHIEAGYVWDREILFFSGDPGEFQPEDTIMLRGGIDF